MPTGKMLTEKIASLLDLNENFTTGDRLIYQALQFHILNKGLFPQQINPYLEASWRIRDAMPQARSIDNFIDQHNDDRRIELCGKLAIVRSILEAEKGSTLFVDPSNIYNSIDFKATESSWFNHFWKLIIDNCRKEELHDRLGEITLIIFNYDRCVEHYLFYSLQNYFGFDPIEASRLVGQIKIYHPYGVVGELPWQNRSGQIKFGAEPNVQQLLVLASQIKTFTEGTDPESSEIMAIRQNVLESNVIVFLGFAFHKLNMKLISPDNSTFGTPIAADYFGTAFGFSKSDVDGIVDEIKQLGPSKQKIYKRIEIRKDLKCSELFDEYSRSLTLS